MSFNEKKPIKLLNNTKYFYPDSSKLYNTFSSPNTYQSRQIKIEGYETRLYWQYRYCEEHNGQTFFYTFTYNDAHIPRPFGFNCFDYEDLRYLLTGGFYQILRRKYGTKFKYFVSAELGDGKGERGMHNNPHYHILFFLVPDDNPLCDYVKITSEDFRHLVRKYWQGFDEDVDGYRSYRTAKFGICKEGSENLGKVTDFRASDYVAKYVCKDVKLVRKERSVSEIIRKIVRKDYKRSVQSYRDYYNAVLKDYYNLDLDISNLTDKEAVNYVYKLMIENELKEDYHRFVRKKIEEFVKEGLNNYRNRYCNKCRISHCVGDYALEFIDDDMNPVILFPSKKGFKNRPISIYYFRKLFTDCFIDEAGSVIRYLNDKGLKYMMFHLPERLNKMAEKAKNNMNHLLNRELFDKILDSDVNDNTFFIKYDDFFEKYNYLLLNNVNKNEIFKRYAEYKLVYEDRFFPYKVEGNNIVYDFPDIDVITDYGCFICPTIYYTTRSDTRVHQFVQSGCKGYLSYFQHPYFLPYISIFHLLDMCTDYFFIQGDNKSQKEAEEISNTKRFHDREKLKEFYSFFK